MARTFLEPNRIKTRRKEDPFLDTPLRPLRKPPERKSGGFLDFLGEPPVATDVVTPTEMPKFRPGRVALVNKERRIRQLHSLEGLNLTEWERLTGVEKEGLLRPGETPDIRRPIKSQVGRTTVFETEGEKRVFAGGEPTTPYQRVEEVVIGAAQTPVTVGPVTLKAGEWAGLFGITIAAGAAVIAGLPIAFTLLMGGAFARNINKLSLQTKTPVDAKTVKEVSDYLARTTKPSFANTATAIKEIFKPSATGKFVPTPQATAKADAYAKGVIQKVMPDFSKTRLDKIITDIRAGKFQPDAVAPSVQAVRGVSAELAKEPWQMTNIEYMTNIVKRSRPDASEAELSRIVSGIPERLTKTEHEGIIQQALSEGKPVPPEVLKDYPDLKAPVTPAPITPPVKPPAEVPVVAEVPPTAPEPTVAPPEAVSEGIPPTAAPPPPETGITAEPPPIEPSGKIRFANLQDAQVVIDFSTKPDISRWIANLPLIREVMSKLNPSAIAGTPGEKAIIARAVLREEGAQKAQGIISYLNELGSQNKVFGKLDENGFIASGKLKGLALNDVRAFPKKYADKLTAEQKEWINRAHEIEVAKLKFMRDNGIKIEELTFEEGGVYAGRRVYALMSSDGELLDSAFVGAGPTRVGKKTAFEKRRFFKTAKEAQDEGYRYLQEDEALSLNVRAAYNRVADKQMSEWLLAQVPWRTTGAPEELVLAAESAKIRSNSSKQLLAGLNRALRGERGVPEQIINSIKTTYPKEAAELQGIIADIRAGRPTASKVKDFDKRIKAMVASNKADSNAAVNARARARERALAPGFGEAVVMHPAFAGKIFTGTEAKELAETMRNALEPKISQALASVNKVNALVRYFKLAGDFSPLGIQLLFLAGQNPKIYGGAAFSIPKLLFDLEWHAEFLSAHKATIDRHPGLVLSFSGTEFTEAMQKGGLLSTSINVLPKQESMAKQLALVVPRVGGKAAATVLQPFQRVFEGTLDYAGIKMAEALEHLASTPAEMAEVDQFINEFRGLTSSAKLGVSPNWRASETASILAPRYNRAIAALLVDAIKGALTFGQSGIRNRLAIQGLTKGVAAVSAMAVAVSLALGEDWEEITEHFDPTSSRFMTWNIAGTNIGPGTKVRSVVKLVAQVIDNPETLFAKAMENPALRFIRGNLAPVPGAALNVLTGRNYIGDPVRTDATTFVREMIVKNFMPIWVENVVYEGGTPSQRLIRGTGEFFGGRAYPETTSDVLNRLYDRYAAQDLGKRVKDLNKLERSQLEQNHSDLAEAKADNEKYWSDRGDRIGVALDIEQQRLEDNLNESLEDAAQKLIDGEITKYDYDKNRAYIRPYTSGGKSALWSLRETLQASEMKQYEKWYEENTKPEDKAYNDYQEYRGGLIETAELPKDWDAINLELENYLLRYSAETQQYILERQDDWINKLPPSAKQIETQRAAGIEDDTWWDNYRGEPEPRIRTRQRTRETGRTIEDVIESLRGAQSSRNRPRNIEDIIKSARLK